MRLIVFTQGDYGERILENIKERDPEDWDISQRNLPKTLPQIVEKPEEFVAPLGLRGSWDLVLYLGESPSAFSLLPLILEKISVEAVIAPVDDYDWLPLGLERQIRQDVEAQGVEIIFPRTFCSLSPVGIQAIDMFATQFGAPSLEITIEGKIVKHVEVLRGAPCGSTHYMAENLPGTRVEKAGARAGTLVQIYPCLASRRRDRHFKDAPIHVAAKLAKRAFERALRG